MVIHLANGSEGDARLFLHASLVCDACNLHVIILATHLCRADECWVTPLDQPVLPGRMMQCSTYAGLCCTRGALCTASLYAKYPCSKQFLWGKCKCGLLCRRTVPPRCATQTIAQSSATAKSQSLHQEMLKQQHQPVSAAPTRAAGSNRGFLTRVSALGASAGHAGCMVTAPTWRGPDVCRMLHVHSWVQIASAAEEEEPSSKAPGAVQPLSEAEKVCSVCACACSTEQHQHASSECIIICIFMNRQ